LTLVRFITLPPEPPIRQTTRTAMAPHFQRR